MMRIHTKAFALSGGIVLGLLIALQTLISYFLNLTLESLNIFLSIYPGFSITPVGSVIGFFYGFLSGAILAGAFSVIYNRIYIKL